MNGFEPLRRRIIDYTVAGQWSEVYDGPLEDCESEKLKAENAQLRDDLETQREAAWHNTKRNAREYKRVRDENDKLRELCTDMWHELNYTSVRADDGTNKCLEHMDEFNQRMEELGVEISA